MRIQAPTVEPGTLTAPPEALLQGLEQSKEGFALTDAEGRFLYMNAEHLRMFGFEQSADVLGRPWTILYEDREIAFIQNTVFPILARERCWTGVLPAKRRDGGSFSEDLTLSLLSDGRIVCNCRDRTREVEMLERTLRSERLLRAFLDHMPAAAAIRDVDGRVLYANPRREDLVGAPVGDGSSQHARLLHDAEARLRSGEDLATFDLPLADGRVFNSRVFAVRAENRELERIGEVALDVTEERRWEAASRRMLEHQTELLEQHRQFVALVSHEFRTPLTVFRGSIYLLRRVFASGDASQAGQYLDMQEKALDGLAELVNRVSLLERLDQRTSDKDSLMPVDLSSLVESVVHARQTSGNEERLDVRLVSSNCLVAGIEPLLRAAIDNLVTNALKFSAPSTRVSVTLTIAEHTVVLEVGDQGIGIPAADHVRVFQPFFRARNTSQQPGVGLGLHLVSKIVEKHGGSVDFTSTEGVGSTFRIKLPVRSAQ